MVWDRGTWTPESPDVDAALKKGDLKFTLHGEKLKGSWVLVRTKGWGGSSKPSWLLIKHRDDFASDEDVAETRPRSVVSNRLLTQIAIDEGGDVEKASTGDPVAEVEKLLKNPKILQRKQKRVPRRLALAAARSESEAKSARAALGSPSRPSKKSPPPSFPRPRLQPEQGLLAGGGLDEGRPRRVLRGRLRQAAPVGRGPAALARALPGRPPRRVLLPEGEARARCRPARRRSSCATARTAR